MSGGLREILDGCQAAARAGKAAVLATVVRVSGSAYRRPGARMLFPPDGPPLGLVSGGCLESDLAERARGVLESGEPQTVVYDMRSPDDRIWGLGLGCPGEVRVLLERIPAEAPPDHLGFLAALLRDRRRGVMVTVFDREAGAPAAVGDRLLLDAVGCRGSVTEGWLREALLADARAALDGGRSRVRDHRRAGAGVSALIEVVEPPIALLVFGAGSDACPLSRMAAGLGWEVTVVDHREAFATPDRFPEAVATRAVDFDRLRDAGLVIDRRTPVVVMTHHFANDLKLLPVLLDSPAPYIGLIGPRLRRENLLRELAAGGWPPSADRLDRLHGPVGLDVGAETPAEIALAVLAEAQSVLCGRAGGFLRERRAPLHDWPS